MKRLRFKLCDAGHYIILNQSDVALGTIELGDIFKRRMVFTSFDIIEFTSECLQQIVSFIKLLESKERLPNRQATAKVRKPKRPAHI